MLRTFDELDNSGNEKILLIRVFAVLKKWLLAGVPGECVVTYQIDGKDETAKILLLNGLEYTLFLEKTRAWVECGVKSSSSCIYAYQIVQDPVAFVGETSLEIHNGHTANGLPGLGIGRERPRRLTG
jgi:hypothetical protein